MSPWEARPGGGRVWRNPTPEEHTPIVPGGFVPGQGGGPTPPQAATVPTPEGFREGAEGATFVGTSGVPAPGQPQEQQGVIGGLVNRFNEWIASLGGGLSPATEEAVAGKESAAQSQAATQQQLLGIAAKATLAMNIMSVSSYLGKLTAGKVAYKTPFEQGKILSYKEANFLAYGEFGSGVANGKTMGLVGNIISSKANWVVGGIVAGAGLIGATVWGMYAGSEAPESPNINMRDIVQTAYQTGDWSTFDEYALGLDALYEEADPAKLKNQIPGYGIGIESINKFNGNKMGWEMLKMHAEDLKSGLSIDEQITKRLLEKEESQKRVADYIDQLARARDAYNKKAAADNQLAMIDYAKMKREWEIENQKFWKEYLELKQKMWEKNLQSRGRSTLGFGLF